jgi:type IV pilus assembly protein PilV
VVTRNSARAGFSLIELMVAIVVLGIGILGLASVFPLGAQNQMKDRLRTSGSDLAQQKLEQLRLSSWSGADLTDGTHPSSSGETLTLQDEGRFNRRWEVVTQAGSFSDMKKVTVKVTWTFLRTDSVQLISYFRK